MPKVKSSVNKTSKKLVSSKKLTFSRGQAIGLFVLLGGIGALLIWKTFAAVQPGQSIKGKEYFYNYGNAEHTSGAGRANAFYLQLRDGSTQFKAVREVNSDNDRSGHYMWWGAYRDLNTDKHPVIACWYFAAPSRYAANIDFSVTQKFKNVEKEVFTTRHNSALYTVKPVTHTQLPSNYPPQLSPWVIQKPFCAAVNTGANGYNKVDIIDNLQIRAKDMGVHPGDENSFKLYQTSYKIVP